MRHWMGHVVWARAGDGCCVDSISDAASSCAECGFIGPPWPPAEHGLAMEELVGAGSADLRHDWRLCHHCLPGSHHSLSASEDGAGTKAGEGEGAGQSRCVCLFCDHHHPPSHVCSFAADLSCIHLWIESVNVIEPWDK